MTDEQSASREDVPRFAEEMYDDLHRIAGEYLRHERKDHTLQPTALIHEAYLKVAHRDEWKSATHFRAVASAAMRQILVDHARRRGRLKRGGGRVMMTTNMAIEDGRDIDVLALDEALLSLARLNERGRRVAVLRWVDRQGIGADVGHLTEDRRGGLVLCQGVASREAGGRGASLSGPSSPDQP